MFYSPVQIANVFWPPQSTMHKLKQQKSAINNPPGKPQLATQHPVMNFGEGFSYALPAVRN